MRDGRQHKLQRAALRGNLRDRRAEAAEQMPDFAIAASRQNQHDGRICTPALRLLGIGAQFGNALCGKGPSQDTPTGASNPFAPGTFHGEIVICDRGTYARVEKGYNVLHAGAGGFVLANAQSDGEAESHDAQVVKV